VATGRCRLLSGYRCHGRDVQLPEIMSTSHGVENRNRLLERVPYLNSPITVE